MNVLFGDNHVLVVAKEAGLPTVPDASGDESLLDRARAWVRVTYGKPGEAFLGVVHRLDRPVSGVVVLARTSKAARRLAEAFRAGRVRKTYWAAVAGAPERPSGELEQWLVKDSERNRVRAVEGPREGARPARTRWRVLARGARSSLVELEPETGRPHQLRVALASLACPILGDLRYGAERPLSGKSIALHALALSFPHPTRPVRCTAEVAPPSGFPWDEAWGERPREGHSFREEASAP